MKQTILSKSTAETEKLAQTIASDLESGNVIGLYGDLGSGKTTFSKALAKALGVERPVQSPTFVLMKEYDLNHNRLKKFYHLDLYRIESYDRDELGLSELFEDSSALLVIEWAERIKNILPDRRIDISFTHESEKTRRIIVNDTR